MSLSIELNGYGSWDLLVRGTDGTTALVFSSADLTILEQAKEALERAA